MTTYIKQILSRYRLVSDQVDREELLIILTELENALQQPTQGAVVELGCYIGTTSLFVRRLMDHHGSEREFHVYDSFAGLPEKTASDSSPAGAQFVVGELSVSKKEFIREFKKANLRPPIIHKTWFSELTDDMMPVAIQFAFLDGDYYESIDESLRAIEGSLQQGSTIIVDDYHNEALPGAKKATDRWLAKHPGASCRIASSLAIITL